MNRSNDYEKAIWAFENAKLGEWVKVEISNINNFRKYLSELHKKKYKNIHLITRNNKTGTFVYMCSDQYPVKYKTL
jgi:hypothetical protein